MSTWTHLKLNLKNIKQSTNRKCCLSSKLRTLSSISSSLFNQKATSPSASLLTPTSRVCLCPQTISPQSWKRTSTTLQNVAPTPLTRTWQSIIFWMKTMLQTWPQMDPVWAQGQSMMKPAGLCQQSRDGNVMPMNSMAPVMGLILQKPPKKV